MALIGSRERSIETGPTWASELMQVLEDMSAAHDELSVAGNAMRAALASADRGSLELARLGQQRALTRIAELDAQRRMVVRRAIEGERELRRLDRSGRREPSVREIAGVLREPMRSELLARGEALRERILLAQREQRVLRAAAGSLLKHVQGLLTQFGRALDGAKTYSRSGGLTPGAAPACGIDLTH
ncbi:MAG: hypothetical protein ACF8SC_02315 [Phycisphaerales bacterium JB037]